MDNKYKELSIDNSLEPFVRDLNNIYTDIHTEFMNMDRLVLLDEHGISFRDSVEQNELGYLLKVVLMRLVATKGVKVSQWIDNVDLKDYVMTQEYVSTGHYIDIVAEEGIVTTTIHFDNGDVKTISELIAEEE